MFCMQISTYIETLFDFDSSPNNTINMSKFQFHKKFWFIKYMKKWALAFSAMWAMGVKISVGAEAEMSI